MSGIKRLSGNPLRYLTWRIFVYGHVYIVCLAMVRTRQKTRLEAAETRKESNSSAAELSTSEPDVLGTTDDRLEGRSHENSSQMWTVEQLALTAASRVTERLRTGSNELEHGTSDANTRVEKRMETEASYPVPKDIPTSR